MKKISLLLLTLTLCFFTACHKSIWEELENLDQRITKLEELCKEMNTNITSLQTIVSVLQSNDYITGIVEIKKNGEVIGYTITFGKHDPITIYHGQDGKDGQNGADGKDGQDGSSRTPVIGVAKDTDGVYYWTLNGEWLLDDNGNKLPVSGTNGKDGQNGSNGQDGTDGKDGQDGTNGKDGQDGADGKDGQDGVDGKDGVTPQLKIEDGYWYISYDNGATWTQLGKATGEDGKDGADGKDGQNGSNGTDGKDGKDGQDGDSMFQSVTQDENYVYFTLADGTVIKIAKGSGSNDQPNSEFIFTITYDPNGGEGVIEKDTFYYGYAGDISICSFIREGYYSTGYWNTNPTGTGASYKEGSILTIDRNIVLYAQWEKALGEPSEMVDLGLRVKWATCNVGAVTPEEYGDYFAWGETKPKSSYNSSTYSYSSNPSVLPLSKDAARVNWGGTWRMPTQAELQELKTNCTWTWTTQNGVKGCKVTSMSNGNSIFLPAAGRYSGSSLYQAGNEGYYWSSTLHATYKSDAYYLLFGSSNQYTTNQERNLGLLIRPVCP